MNLIYTVFGTPLGYIMWFLHKFIGNYGLSLLIFTIITRLAMLPLSINQQKSSAKLMVIKPMLEEVQKKYKNNKEKLQEETMKLYQDNGYNPASGCLPLLIQMPILFGLIDVIYKPLTHILRLPADVIESLKTIFLSTAGEQTARAVHTVQLGIIRAVKLNPADYTSIGSEAIEKIMDLNLNFLGMDLTQTPSTSMFGEIFTTGFNILLLVPILSGVSSLVMSLLSMKSTAMSQPEGAGTMKGMMLTMPLMSTWIAFTVPAGVGMYWFFSNLCSIVQTYVLNKVYNPEKIVEKARADYEEKKERERLEKKEARKKLKESKENMTAEELEKALSQKELNRKKLAEARKRYAEKYGDVYDQSEEDE